MQDVYKNIENYNPNKEREVLIIFDDTIANIINNRKLNPIVTYYLLESGNLIFLLFYYTILF